MAAYDFERLRVLVVDDNAYMVTIIRTLLDSMGIKTVHGLSSGDHLLPVMREWQPDILIVDHFMEPKNGLQLIREIRETVQDRQRFIPIILITSYAKQEVVVKARFWAGADAVLVKPMSARRLFNCIVALYESERTFVRTGTYFGPDRRLKDRPFEGQNRRQDEMDEMPGPDQDDDAEEEQDFLYLDGCDDEDPPSAQRTAG